MRKKLGVIFLERGKPGTIGGVQIHGSRLADGLRRSFKAEHITWHGPLWASMFYTPGFYVRAARSSGLLVHCDDALTSLIGSLIRSGTGKKVVAFIHTTC